MKRSLLAVFASFMLAASVAAIRPPGHTLPPSQGCSGCGAGGGGGGGGTGGSNPGGVGDGGGGGGGGGFVRRMFDSMIYGTFWFIR